MEQDRRIISQLVSRPFRDKAFAAAVKTAYRDTCAMTGLKLINGGGRSEVQAAHIRPVEHNGTDSVRNGIALSGTMHWMSNACLAVTRTCCRLHARIKGRTGSFCSGIGRGCLRGSRKAQHKIRQPPARRRHPCLWQQHAQRRKGHRNIQR